MEVTLRVDTAAAEAQLGDVAERGLLAALLAGLGRAANIAAGEVQMRYKEAGLKSPTGTLAQSIGCWPGIERLTWWVGVPDDSPAARYAYLITEDDAHIVPRGHKYLAIPIGENLTPAGVALVKSPRQVSGLVFRGQTAGVLVGEEYHPWFALTKEVWIFGRGILEDGTRASELAMRAAVQAEVDKVMN